MTTAPTSVLRAPAWKGKGTILDTPTDDESAIRKAGLDWEVNLIEPAFPTVTRIGDDSLTEYHPLTGYRAVIRSDNRAALGMVTDNYEPMQNRALFDVVRGIAPMGLTWEIAGELKGGETVWGLARINDLEIVVKGDRAICHLLAVNGHTGKRAVRLIPMTLRVRCSNILGTQMRRQDRARRANGYLNTLNEGWVVHHDKSMTQRIEEAVNAYRQAIQGAEETRQAWTFLADAKLTRERWESMMAALFVAPTHAEDEAARAVRMERERTQKESMAALLDAPTNQTEATAGTMFGALNAVTEYVDHFAGRDGTRFQSAVFGHGAAIKRVAYESAMALAH